MQKCREDKLGEPATVHMLRRPREETGGAFSLGDEGEDPLLLHSSVVLLNLAVGLLHVLQKQRKQEKTSTTRLGEEQW